MRGVFYFRPMQTFIEEVVLAELEFDQLEKVYVVPSRRAGARLRQVLAIQSNTTLFAPEIYAIEEFIARISELRQASNATQLFTLYTSYLHCLPKEHHESFRTFCGWAQTVLADFNEIDRYLIPQESIFGHLRDIQDLTAHWSHNTSSVLVKNYLRFWDDLGRMYTHFCETLVAQGIAHQGLLYRKAVENLDTYIQATGEKRYVFVGFNALNSAEQQLVQGILAYGSSEIYWDIEKHFQDDVLHEVSTFTRVYAKRWTYYEKHPFNWIANTYHQAKTIKAYACTSDITQVKTVPTIVKELSRTELETTAIVLGDESLLVPLLNALPNTLTNLNITMGIPLGQTPLASFFDALFVMKRSPAVKGYYYKDLLEVISHPFVRLMIKKQTHSIQQRLAKDNITFITPDRLLSFIDSESDHKFLKECVRSWDTPRLAIESCLHLISIARSTLQTSNDPLQLEYLFGFYKVFNQVSALQEENDYIEDIPTLTFFYREILAAETIDLKGDPERGLQIMGVLESRVLDYENVIITSVNEGTLPSGKSQNSFIPYDLKRQYGLPTYFEKDAIYAYHFYRLLFRARKISLLYTTESEGLGSVEKSRFIRQLVQENVHKVHDIQVITSLHNDKKQPFAITKSPEIIDRLNALCKKGLSPSALTTYLRNPILFYERYVLGVQEIDMVEETVAANTMGTIVHNTLEDLYTPYINQRLTLDILRVLIQQIEPTVRDQFKKEYGLEFITNGKNLIIYEVILRYIKNYLTLEMSRIEQGDEIIITSLEDDLKNIPLTSNIYMRGKVDLVEKRNNQLNIIDYKTGKVEQRDLNLTNWQDLLLPEGKHEKAFQVLMYTYMMHKSKPLDFPVCAGIISFKNLQAGFLPFRFGRDEQITQETLDAFEQVLKQLVQEILDPSIPFTEREV